MSTGPRVAVILLDGTDPPSIARYIDAGWLPSLAKAFRHARRIDLRSLGDLFLTSPWPCVASGVAVENHGIHAFRPIKSGTLDIVEASEHHIPTPFWETAVRAGLRASVIDVPICGPPPQEPALEGLRFLEWGSHPVVRPAGSLPPAFIAEVERRHGVHPQRDDDPATKTADELRVAQRRICQGVHARERIVMDLLDQDSPDLLVACFSEAHAAGHQFLNLTADNHPHYDAGVVAELGAAPLRQVYRAIDAAVGHILARLPADTTVLVTCMGGLRPSHGGSLLLDDILRRSGLTAPAAAQRGFARRLWRLAPVRFRRAVAKRLARYMRRVVDARFWASFDWGSTRAFALPWTYDGYLRVNQRGREPFGIVDSGAERSKLLDQIEAMLAELRIAGTGRPAVRRIVRTQDVYVGRASTELPDLMVLWNDDQPFDGVESPRVGFISNRDHGPRGAHTNEGVIFAWGPNVAAGPNIAGARDIDIAPTVLAMLGIAPPDTMDGHILTDLMKPLAVGVAAE